MALLVKEHRYKDGCIYNGEWEGRRRSGQGVF